VLPERTIGYRSLVIAVGSTSNYFGVPGAREHTISLNATEDAERFRLRLLRLLAQAEQRNEEGAAGSGLDIVIIGGGATGVELAAELREASGVYATVRFLGACRSARRAHHPARRRAAHPGAAAGTGLAAARACSTSARSAS
jgi:NAD(P)H-nitrite reductase large subunit